MGSTRERWDVCGCFSAISHRRHQGVHLPPPPDGSHQLLDAPHHVPQLHHVPGPAAEGEGPHQVPVDEQPGDGRAHGPGQAGERLHLADIERTAA